MAISSKIILAVVTFTTLLLTVSCTKTPVACYTADKGKTAKENEEVQFNASCSSDAETFTWAFGDGTTGTGVQVKHKYSTAGVYVLKLTATNGSKSNILSQDFTISK